MHAREWQKIKAVFALAKRRPGSERADFVREACGGDTALRAKVGALLEAHDEPEHLIERSDYGVASIFNRGGAGYEGKRLGHYTIIREIGRGGMGTVYLGERADDYRKRAAVKVVRRGMDSEDILRRFRNERQILASLEHENIARLLDGGTTDDGLPYLVMEYVEGTPVNDYCDLKRLTTNERLRIFRTVCAAVEHAHQNLVVHRDLKPSNILITSDGRPKLLDFGIAKVLNPDVSALPVERTVTELRLLTPDYASPEQLRGERPTTASDVYSLGVVLYGLLTGHRPYRSGDKPPHEFERAISEEEPTKPSTVVGRVKVVARRGGGEPADTITPESVSTARGTQPDKLRRRLAGDLDNIVLMAMRKEPRRRYASVGQFSEDIRRHLEGLPVTARKTTFKYRATKFVRRNRVGVAAAALVVLSLVGGIIATAWQAERATRQARIAAEQRDRARIEAAKAERINAFLQNMLTYADPSWYSPGRGLRGDVKVIDVLRESAGRIDTELADQPEVRAEMHHTVGNTYRALGRHDLAGPHFRSALELSRRIYGDEHPKVARDLYYMGAWLQGGDDMAAAISHYRQAIAMMRATDAENVNLPYMLQDLGASLLSDGDAATSETLGREALELFRRRYGEEHLMVALSFERLGLVYEARGELGEAEAAYREAIERFTRLSDRQILPGVLRSLGNLKVMKGEYAEAEALLRESLDLTRKNLGESHPEVARSLVFLAEVQLHRGDYAAAEKATRAALEIYRQASPRGSSHITGALGQLSKTLIRAGSPARAEPYLREALAWYGNSAAKGHHMHDPTAGDLGECLTLLGRYAEAEPLLAESYDLAKARSSERHPRTLEALRRLVALYDAWGKPDRASHFRALLRENSN